MAAVGYSVGEVWMQVVPSMRGVKKSIESELSGVNVGGVSRGWGESIRSNLAGAFKAAAAVGVASIGAIGASVAGLAIKGGIDRALSIENAEAKLTGLGHSAQSVDQIMSNALASVKGTAYGLGDAATVAAGLVASGVEQGEGLQNVLATVADTAQISGKSMTDVGAIFGSVAARGKLQGDDLLQLTSAGVPALAFLSEQLGVTSAEVSDMVSKGQIDFDTFATAMQVGLGGAALAAGETFTGAWANVKSALSRGGAMLMTPILDGLRLVFNALIPVIDQATAALAPFADMLGKQVGAAAQALASWLGTVDFSGISAQMTSWIASIDMSAIIDGFATFGEIIGGVFSAITEGTSQMGSGAAAAGVGELGGALGEVASHAPALLASFGDLAASVVPVLTTVVGFLADNMDKILVAIPLIVGGVLAWQAATQASSTTQQASLAVQSAMLPVAIANNITRVLAANAERQLAAATAGRTASTIAANTADNVGALTKARGVAATIAHKAATLGATIATKAAAAAQWAMNAAMSANPIGIIIVAIAALVAALVWFFTQTELGQQIWQAVVDAISTAVTWLWETIIKPVFDAIGAIFTWLYENVIQYVIMGVVLYFKIWGAIFTWLWENIVAPVFAAIGAIFEWIYNNIIVPIIGGIVLYFQIWGAIFEWLYVNVVQPIFAAIGAIFEWIYNYIIVPIINGIVLYFQIWGAIFTWLYQNVVQPVFTAIGAVFTWLYENIIKPVWEGIQAAIQVVADWFTNTLWPGIETTLGNIGRGFEVLKDAIATAWQNIQNAAKEPVRFIVETVYNDGIRATFNQIAEAVGLNDDARLPKATLPPGFASGGVLPGWSPGRDIHQFFSPTGGRLALSGGEAIMRPEFTRAVGGAAGVAAINAAARAGRPLGFADGGIWDAIGGTFAGAADWLSGVVSAVAEIIADPAGAIDRLILDPVRSLLDSTVGGTFGQIVAEGPLKLVEGVKTWLATLLAPTTGGVNGDWVGGNTLQRLLPYIAASGTFITDTYRDPAYNAAVGGSPTSYHMDAANPAVDVAGSNAAMWAFYNMVMADPGGWRQVLWQVAGHYDHVHVARKGGVFGDLPSHAFDSGGLLQPGLSLAYNGTGRPEPVFTADQWDTLRRGGLGGALPRRVVLEVEGREFTAFVREEATDVAVRTGQEAGVW